MNKEYTDVVMELIKEIKGINVRSDTGAIRVREYGGGTEKTLGHSNTLSEALQILKGDHWISTGEEESFGFIYRIIDTKERKAYIGRKQYKYYDKAKSTYTIDSNWEVYSGSCKPLKLAFTERPEDFIFYKILECKDRDELGYAEHYLIREIFGARQVTGEYEYYNRVLPKLYMGQVEGVSEEFVRKVDELRVKL